MDRNIYNRITNYEIEIDNDGAVNLIFNDVNERYIIPLNPATIKRINVLNTMSKIINNKSKINTK